MVGNVVITIVIVLIGRVGWKLLNWAWLKPRKLEKWMRSEGYKGNSYKLVIGDMKELAQTMKEGKTKSIPISHDIAAHVLPFDHQIITKYGKKSFIWFGPTPRIYIMEPELIKEILSRPNDFLKPHPDQFRDSVISGLLVSEGQKWAKNRQIMNPAFHLENIKGMFPAICSSCRDMVSRLEKLTAGTGPVEVDVWPYIDSLAGDVLARTAFGSSYEEGQKIFQLQKEQMDLAMQNLLMLYLPGGRFIPTKVNKKFKENDNELRSILMDIINKKKKAIATGEGWSDDLLGLMLKSNLKEIEEDGVGMSMEEIIDEGKLFYVGGSETTSSLMIWAVFCLGLHQDWQHKAREEVLQVFGTKELHYEGLKHLKIVTMILNEALRLYPPVVMAIRATNKETKLGNMTMPAGVNIALPMIRVQRDRDLWGEDALEFKPERFAEGIAHATKGLGSGSFFPFTGGPRVCIGQNIAMAEAKATVATILQRFSFELSPSYKHSPFPMFTLPPTFGVPLILREL
ncbi:putative secologanin synthase [Helianthus annuus]|uniref:Putative cytochrome P450 n=1 Tax=Helianthus annuus TaxID=4232 RepID=A0A251V6E5_HELAN|nr:cytochrome P450 CYP72A219 [Helianthus annuus]KAF5814708.1 putative secologanin synthase [Helianthus annuus]KAJ0936021.1 putative secologanin synthase [Helianthus annuus]KAJ0943947.1 putative secologanin synthase [Helianthus annuus]